jgi:hypothetical protein
VELFVFRPGYGAEREAIEPFYQAMSRAHGSVRPEPLVHGDPVFSSMWRDHQVFNKFGVPSVTYGPSRYKPTIRDMMDCTRVYAAAMLETCLNPAS